MEEKKISRIYYLETFLLLAFSIAVTLILSQVFVKSKAMSDGAKELTNAVCIAENIAEVSKGCRTADELSERMRALQWKGADQTGTTDTLKGALFFDEDMAPASEGCYSASFDFTVSEDGQTTMKITVFRRADNEAVYSLTAGDFVKEVEP